MPCLGLTSLHFGAWETMKRIVRCVNALSRAHVSARSHRISDRKSWTTCQCPVSGSRLCTIAKRGYSFDADDVSMPCLGLTSLHSRKGGNAMTNENLVSMPCLGLTSLHLTPQKPQYLYGFQAVFFVYFSELSDFCVQ